MKYYGFTHLPIPNCLLWLLRRFLCKRGIHLWDEVMSGGAPWRHYFACDACDMVVDIQNVDDTDVKL